MNRTMVIHVSAEEVATIREAILTCANELTVAVNCENRFDESIFENAMSELADIISRADEDLERTWFSALIRVRGGATQMLTTPECRTASKSFMLHSIQEQCLTVQLLFS